MCGRTACTLAPDDICKACAHQSRKGKTGGRKPPRWRDAPGGQKYYTSYNIAPGSHTPVLLSKRHFDDDKKEMEEEIAEEVTEKDVDSEWVVQPMHWGLVPHWSKDAKSTGYSMINARSDGILSKNSFKRPLEKGRRCVVLVDGYYEWQTASDGKKQPYFISFPAASEEDVKFVNEELEKAGETPWTGRRLLTMAGLFDIWRPKDDGAPLYSYSIITVDAHKSLSFLHERMPAILNGEEEVRQWLDSGEIPLSKAVPLIRSVDSVQYYPVSDLVSNVRNKSEECMKPIDLEKEKKKSQASSNLMMSWLKGSRKRSSEGKAEKDECGEGPSAPKQKKEEPDE